MSLFEELQSALQILVAPRLEAIVVRLDGMDIRLDMTEKRMDRIEQKMDRIEERFEHLEERAERRHDDLIAQQRRFRDDILNEIRTAINFQALASRVERVEKAALSEG